MNASIRDVAHTSDAPDRLFIAHYEQLRRMAQRELRYGVRATLGPTTLLHETFLDVSRRASLRFADGGQFMAYAARAMRGLVICHLRNRHAQKRGGGLAVTCLPMETPQAVQGPTQTIEIEKLSQALESLAQIDPRLAECVDLKFFCGYSFKEIAQTRCVAERTVPSRVERGATAAASVDQRLRSGRAGDQRSRVMGHRSASPDRRVHAATSHRLWRHERGVARHPRRAIWRALRHQTGSWFRG